MRGEQVYFAGLRLTLKHGISEPHHDGQVVSYEVGDVQRVLDGDLDGFVEAYLEQRARGTAE